MINEQTLVIFKPDVVQRQIVGELITRFERKGLKIVAMKMLKPSKELVSKHYTDDPEYNTGVGEKAIQSAKDRGEKVTDKTPLEIGLQVREWNIEYLSCGPVVALVLQGSHAAEIVRTLLGKTNPLSAEMGSIRGDYTPDSFLLADSQGRTTRTLMHASGDVSEAKREIPLWFSEEEIMDYKTAIEHILYDAGWSKNS